MNLKIDQTYLLGIEAIPDILEGIYIGSTKDDIHIFKIDHPYWGVPYGEVSGMTEVISDYYRRKSEVIPADVKFFQRPSKYIIDEKVIDLEVLIEELKQELK